MATDNEQIRALVTAEVVALHDFISAWFRGDIPNTDAVFMRGFANRTAPDLVNIQPSGAVLTRADLLEPIRAAYGANPDFRIAISDVAIRFVDAEQGLVLATYVEHQTGARNTTPSDNDRVSTVLFRREDGDRLVWLHIHETAVPVVAVDAG